MVRSRQWSNLVEGDEQLDRRFQQPAQSVKIIVLVLAVCASVLKLIFHRADTTLELIHTQLLSLWTVQLAERVNPVVHLLLLKFSTHQCGWRNERFIGKMSKNYFQKSHFKDRSISGHPSIGLHPHREKLPTRPASQGHRGQGLRLRGQAWGAALTSQLAASRSGWPDLCEILPLGHNSKSLLTNFKCFTRMPSMQRTIHVFTRALDLD